jgi:hypothetical protein
VLEADAGELPDRAGWRMSGPCSSARPSKSHVLRVGGGSVTSWPFLIEHGKRNLRDVKELRAVFGA